MADLIQVRIENFRAFPEAIFNVPVNGLVLVTGQNNAGKSAFLSALDVIAGRYDMEAVRHAGATSPARVWARFRLSDQERLKLLGEGPNASVLFSGGAAEWLEWEFTEIVRQMQAITLTAKWPNKGKIPICHLVIEAPSQWKLLGPGGQSLAAWTPPEISQVMGGGGDPQQFIEQAFNVPSISPAADLLSNWRETYFHFKPLRQAAARRATLSSEPNLLGDGSNLAEVLLHLQSNKPRVWKTLSRLIEEIVPGVGTLMLPSEADQFSIAFLDSSVEDFHHNLKDLGTGVEQLLMTLVVGLTANARTVVLEEPETGLHPAAQRALLSMLQEWSSVGRVFAASTHSPVLLDWGNATVLAVSRRGSASTLTLVADERAEILRDLGVRLSDVLAAERILVLEGPTDQNIINAWFPHLIRDPRLAVINGGGGQNARYASLLASWLDHADSMGGRRVLYLRDRDELGVEALRKLEASRTVYVLPCREIENLLFDFEVLTAVINERRAKQGEPTVEKSVVEAKAREVADKLRQVVVLKRVMAELEPIRLADHALRGKLAKQDADCGQLIAAVLSRLPGSDDLTKLIETTWETHAQDVEGRWNEEWSGLVPGADLLKGLWQAFLGQGYGKAVDGLEIAKRMRAPEPLRQVMEDFMCE